MMLWKSRKRIPRKGNSKGQAPEAGGCSVLEDGEASVARAWWVWGCGDRWGTTLEGQEEARSCLWSRRSLLNDREMPAHQLPPR